LRLLSILLLWMACLAFSALSVWNLLWRPGRHLALILLSLAVGYAMGRARRPSR